MDDTQTEVEKGVAAAVPKRARGPAALRLIDPQTKELFAEWLEYQVAKFPQRIADAERIMKADPGNDMLRNQVTYWRAAVALAKQWSYYIRRSRSQ